MSDSSIRRFSARATRTGSRGVTIPFPFEPAEAWGNRDRYHVTGTIGGLRVRTTLVPRGGAWWIELGPKSGSAAPIVDGDVVEVELWPEGPQSEKLAADIAEALAARPRA